MYCRPLTLFASPVRGSLLELARANASAATPSIFSALRPGLALLAACLCLMALPGAANAEEFPMMSPSQLPGSLQELRDMVARAEATELETQQLRPGHELKRSRV